MNAVAETPGSPEAGPLAREMAAGVRELVELYKREYGLSTPEAVAQARESLREREESLRERERRALQCPPTEVSWADLEWLLERDPQKFFQRWEEIKRAAREELRSGHRAPQAVELYGSTPWKRAEFLALRQELVESWQPRNGVERQLLEMMVQAQTAAEYWLKRLMAKAALEAAMEQATLRKNGQWEPPRATAFQAVEQAGAMAERFNRVFLRTLRALQDLRRHTPAVVVQNVGGQVNVGAQQVNVAHHANGRNRATSPHGEGSRRRGSPRACTCPADRDILIGKNG